MKVGTDGVLLGAWAGCAYPRRILDIGTGTGLIALMLAQRFPEADITAIEIDPQACEEAAGNFRRSPWASRLKLICGDFLNLPADILGEPFDLIVSNPPFFTNGALAPDTARLTARHEITLPLERLIETARAFLSPTGQVSLILPADHEGRIRETAVFNRLELSRMIHISTVPTKPPRRLLVELTHNGGNAVCESDHLSIHSVDGNFTDKYINLLKDFYLNF